MYWIVVLNLFLFLNLTNVPVSESESETVFIGFPVVKVSEGGIERFPENLPRERASNLRCVISKIGKDYYWASRENVRLVRIESGAFITFLAVNGSGYVRIVDPEQKEDAALMGLTEETFDYTEHLILGLRSVSYWGAKQN